MRSPKRRYMGRYEPVQSRAATKTPATAAVRASEEGDREDKDGWSNVGFGSHPDAAKSGEEERGLRGRAGACDERPGGDEWERRRHVAADVHQPHAYRGEREEHERRYEGRPPPGAQTAGRREDGGRSSEREPGRRPGGTDPSDPEKDAGE
jgi:hypothetical protein